MKLSQYSFGRNLFPLLALCALAGTTAQASPTTAYTQPNPSNDEQYMLELINAARANPAAEGQRLANISDPDILRYYNYYNVNTATLVSQFAGYAAKQPLAFNAELMASSRQQSLDQATNGFQGHNGTDGSTFDGRITAQGYDWSMVGENVYAYATGAYFSHVAFNVDWGVPSLDHRANIMNTDASYPDFREVGISCVGSSVSGFGPMVVTQDFGTPMNGGVSYLVGVVYNDANSDGAYQSGEGLGGVTVTPDGGTYYAVTSASGGFVIPLPTNGSGTLTITASGGALGAPRTKTVQYTTGTNVKVDFTTADAAGPTLPTVVMTAGSKDANSASGQTADITLTRDGSTDQPLVVSLWFGGTAVNGVDCNLIPSTLTIPAGAASVTFTVAATNPALTSVAKMKIHVGTGNGYTLAADVQETKARVRIWPPNS